MNENRVEGAVRNAAGKVHEGYDRRCARPAWKE